jgi:hypothetical protein
MNLPHAELLAPTSLVDRISSIPFDASVASIFGRAPDLPELKNRPSLERLWVSGIAEKHAPTLGEMSWLRQLVVHDWRAPNLCALSHLRQLQCLRVAGSPKLRSLDGLADLTSLRELILFDCCNYESIEPLSALPAIETLCLEGGFSKTLRIASLAALAHATTLRRLRLASVRVGDGSLRPLHGLSGLGDVFIAKTFPESELRAAAAALPSARGEFLDSFRSPP